MRLRRRWLFGDQLGPYFLDDPGQPVMIIESRRVFERRAFHRQKAHLILSAMRHRAAELGDQCRYFQAGSYAEALAQIDEPLDAIQPTSWGAVHYLDKTAAEREIERLPARGYATSRERFAEWADGRGRKAVADGGLLPRRANPAGRADGPRRAGHRPMELRHREP